MIRTLLAALLLTSSAAAQDYDLVIRNAKILDGAGNPWVRGDVAVKGDRIAKLGVVAGKGAREIDARGRFVSPGFIDMMDQSGGVLRKNGAAENKLRMGVTTVIAGEGGIPVDADQANDYFAQLETQGIAVNFGSYYSAAQARVKVMGDAAGTPNAVQMEQMKREVETAMRAGTFGISTALIYPPNSFQTTEDLIELAKIVSRCDGFYSTHMRDESSKLVEAVNEAIAIGEKGGVKVEIFHLKAAYAPQFGKLMPKAVAAIDAARKRGVDVAADLYPYTAGGTGLSIVIPNWVFEKGAKEGVELLQDPAVRARVKREVAAGSQPGWSNLVEASGGWSRIVLANPFNEKYERFRGKNIAEIAKALGKDPIDAAIDITVEALPNRAMALFFMMDERDIATALRQSWTSIGSDAAASLGAGQTDVLGLPHPRSYGTFPRVLAEYVKKRGVLTLEDAVRKMTSWPASRMGLEGRGVLREGLYADLVMFDLDKIDDRASWTNPTASPVGIDLVVVNGAVTIEDGNATTARGGKVLRHACKS
ncbi:N-acyl-D-amino-acid deacylase family protein [Roseiterribacter gracilis]|uniref:Aminoacylase n=1 Tax=Roseiterribacter gracilis TaxID=2812848 RepID=A0A8S8XDF4_9PROT|nr:aminoacylase [Rhodospirillales bacterium TMPK1]